MKVCLSFSTEKARRILGKPKDCLGKKIILIAGGFKPSNPIKLVLKDLQQTSVLEIWFFFLSGFLERESKYSFLINLSTRRFTTLMCWSINWYSDKPPFSLNVLIRLILSPELCSWEVSAMSSLLSLAQSPAHVEIIGLNTFTASSGPQHQVSIGIWGGGQMTGQWCKKNRKKGEKRDKEKKKERGRVAFTMQSEAPFKMICLGVGTAITGSASPGVQLPSTFLLMSSSIHLQGHPSWPGSPTPQHPFTKEAVTPQFNNRNTKLKLPAGVKGPKAAG